MPTIDPPVHKLSIRSLEGPRIVVTAMLNPKEITIDKSVPWQKQPTSTGDQPELQFSSAEGRVMSFELLFDGNETGTNVYAAFVDDLQKLASVLDPNGPEDKKRPPMINVRWNVFPEFKGVIESLSTQYTMFLPDGTPVRASCRIRIREASRLAFAK